MATVTTVAELQGTFADRLVRITDLGGTAVNDVSGDTTNISVYMVEIDCRNNPGEHVYFRLFNHLSPTVGTTAAEMLLKGYRGTLTRYEFSRGVIFATGLSVAAVTNKGTTTGSSNPSGQVDVKIMLNSTDNTT